MRTDSGMNDTLSLGFMHYTTAVSLEMSDEPFFRIYLYKTLKVFCFSW